MRILRSAREFLHYRETLSKSIGFVPTMGALHEGHISLINISKAQNEHTVVSIFVNPTQFLPSEDLSRYPRREEADLKLCSLAAVDAIFLPDKTDIYASDEPKVCAPDGIGYIMEGRIRPGHFDGVLTVVLKLLNLVRPENAYFGQKDAQQLALIKQMAQRFFIQTNIVGCQTVREKDGLAMSSRNAYLDATQRRQALALSDALFKAAALIGVGELCGENIKSQMLPLLGEVQTQYIEVTDRNLAKLEKVVLGDTIIHIACKVGSTRLIDNIWI